WARENFPRALEPGKRQPAPGKIARKKPGGVRGGRLAPPSRDRLRGDERPRELAGLEGDEIVQALPDAQPADGETERIGDGKHHAPLGAPVELREHEPGDTQRLMELARLIESVLPRRRVEHEEHLVRRPRNLLLD